MHWRAMAPTDLSDIDRIARIVHPDFPERIEAFDEKLALSPSTHFVAADEDGAVRGYACAYPWLDHDVPKLDTLIGKLPDDIAVLYIHDVALLPTARGLGLIESLIPRLEFLAREADLRALTLTAIYGSEVAWFRYGFERVPLDEKLKRQIAHYGSAVFLRRPVDLD